MKYELEYLDDDAWKPVPNQQRAPVQPTGHRANTIQFAALDVQKLRAVFTHAGEGRTGLSEFEAWGEGSLPYTPASPPPGNLALNMKGEGFPKASASFSDRFGGIPKSAIDGRVNYSPTPVNRWTSYASTNARDWLEVDFGSPKEVGRVEIYLFDDRGGVQAPESYTVQYFANGEWRDVVNPMAKPAAPTGSAINTATFTQVSTAKLRVVFTHKGKARSGVTELEVWKE